MRRLGASGIISLVILFLAKNASGQELAAVQLEPPADPSSAFMRVYGSTEPPQAFVRFCEEYPEECAATSRAEGRVPASPKLLTELKEINGRVNQSITAERDMKHYGWSRRRDLPLFRL